MTVKEVKTNSFKSDIVYINERLETKIKAVRKTFTHETFSEIWGKLSDKQKNLVDFGDTPVTDVILTDLDRALKKVVYALKETDTEYYLTDEEAYKLMYGDLEGWKSIEEINDGAEDHYAYFTGIYQYKKTGKFYSMSWTTIAGDPDINDTTLQEVVPEEKKIIKYVLK